MKRGGSSSPLSLFSFQDIITGLCGVLVLFVLVMVLDLVVRRDAMLPSTVDTPVPEDPFASETALRREIGELEARTAEIRAELEKRRVVTAKGVSSERKEESEREISEKEREAAALLSQADALRTRLEKARGADAKSKKALQEMEATRRTLEAGLAEMKNHKGVTLIPERGNLKSPVYIVLGNAGVEIFRPVDKGAHPIRASRHEMAETIRNVLSLLDNATHMVVLLVRPSGADDMMPVAALVRTLGFACGRDPLEEDVAVAFGPANGGVR